MIRAFRRFWHKYFHSSGNTMLIYQYMGGKFRVKYPDGKVSQPFDYSTAKNYRDIFGGEIIDNF
jgi:hypothetical protein